MEVVMQMLFFVLCVGVYLGVGTMNFIDSHRKLYRNEPWVSYLLLGFFWYGLGMINLYTEISMMISQAGAQ